MRLGQAVLSGLGLWFRVGGADFEAAELAFDALVEVSAWAFSAHEGLISAWGHALVSVEGAVLEIDIKGFGGWVMSCAGDMGGIDWVKRGDRLVLFW